MQVKEASSRPTARAAKRAILDLTVIPATKGNRTHIDSFFARHPS